MLTGNEDHSGGHATLQSSLSDQAYLAIREQILRGHLPLGAPLSRRKLAEQLDMSLLPVSEALQRLEGDGLVESKPRVGTRVSVPTALDVRERYVMREALECQAARLFAARAKPGERLELKRMAEHMDVLFNRAAAGDGDVEFIYAVHSYHFQIHIRIAECARCEALRAAIEKNQVLVFNWLFDVSAKRGPLPPRFHRELLEVVAGADPDSAEAAMRRHIEYGLEEIVQSITPRESGEWRLRRKGQRRKDGQRQPPPSGGELSRKESRKG